MALSCGRAHSGRRNAAPGRAGRGDQDPGRRRGLRAPAGAECDVTGIAAGLHALCELPPGLAEDRVVAAAAARGLVLDGLAGFSATGRPDRAALVVGYGSPPEHAFSGTVDRLCAALRDCG